MRTNHIATIGRSTKSGRGGTAYNIIERNTWVAYATVFVGTDERLIFDDKDGIRYVCAIYPTEP